MATLLSERSAATLNLENAAMHSDAGDHSHVPACCNIKAEQYYSPYYKTKITDELCYRGYCRLSGRSLGGTPGCEKMTISGEIEKAIQDNNANQAGSAWQYFGSQAGVSTMYPASVPSACQKVFKKFQRKQKKQYIKKINILIFKKK